MSPLRSSAERGRAERGSDCPVAPDRRVLPAARVRGSVGGRSGLAGGAGEPRRRPRASRIPPTARPDARGTRYRSQEGVDVAVLASLGFRSGRFGRGSVETLVVSGERFAGGAGGLGSRASRPAFGRDVHPPARLWLAPAAGVPRLLNPVPRLVVCAKGPRRVFSGRRRGPAVAGRFKVAAIIRIGLGCRWCASAASRGAVPAQWSASAACRCASTAAEVALQARSKASCTGSLAATARVACCRVASSQVTEDIVETHA